MNKTVTINISGIVFHIEEDAYEKLGTYLRTVRNRFSEEDGRDEIMADIEARIAEILNQRTGPSRQVVLMADVDYVISLMGEPEAISDQEEKSEDKNSKEETRSSDFSRRRRRRLYRDPEDKVVGGVCSGLGYYFDIDPVWIRIGFAISFFVFGTGVLFYFLLMIIIPRAETTAEKLEMRGEPVDVNNISKTIKEEFGGFKSRVEDLGEEAKEYGKKWRERSREWQHESRTWRRSHRARGAFEDFFHGVFHVMGRVIAFLLIFAGVLLLIGLLTSTFAMSDLNSNVFGETISSFFPGGAHYALAITGFLLLFGIPILMLIYKGIRMMFRITRRDRIVGYTALGLWLTGLLLTILSGINISKGFSSSVELHDTFHVDQAKADTLFLRVNIDPDMMNEDYNSRTNRRHNVSRMYKAFSAEGSELKFGFPDLRIIPSDNDSIELVVYKTAYGQTEKEAQSRAKEIVYSISQKDSLITLNSFFTMGKGQHWRGQDVSVELRLPKNKVIYLDATTREMLDDIENTTNTLDKDMVDRRWKMTAHGLECIDCAGLEMLHEDRLPVTDDTLAHPKIK